MILLFISSKIHFPILLNLEKFLWEISSFLEFLIEFSESEKLSNPFLPPKIFLKISSNSKEELEELEFIIKELSENMLFFLISLLTWLK